MRLILRTVPLIREQPVKVLLFIADPEVNQMVLGLLADFNVVFADEVTLAIGDFVEVAQHMQSGMQIFEMLLIFPKIRDNFIFLFFQKRFE